MAGVIDAAAKQFLEDKTVSREIINLAVPGLLAPDCDLKSMNPEEIAVLFDRKLPKKERLSAVARFRDLLFSASLIFSDGTRDYILIGIENQTHVDYSMPVRVFLDNALDYAWQMQRIADRNRKEGQGSTQRGQTGGVAVSAKAPPMNSAEFLSGFRATDRLKPVITIVICWSTDPWTGPRHLQDLMDLPDNLKDIVDNNILIILEPALLTDEQIDSCSPDLRLVLEILKLGNDIQRLEANAASDPAYAHVNAAAAQMIEALTGGSIQFPKEAWKGDRANMIPAIEQMKEIERNKARVAEIIATARDLHADDQYILIRLQNAAGLSEAEAREALTRAD